MARDYPRTPYWKVDKPNRIKYLRSNLKTGRRLGLYDARLRRVRFDNYRQVHLPAIDTQGCYVCLCRAVQWHHIVQLSMGGVDSHLNLVPLCHSCHKRVHRHKPVRTNRVEQPFVSPLSGAKEILYVSPET